MNDTRKFAEPPAMGKVFLSALRQKRPRFVAASPLPELRSTLAPQPLHEEALERYRDACGARAAVPAGYPQMVITPVHVALLTSDAFPIRAMGLVHPRVSITQHRPLELGEALAFESWFGGLREVHNGVEFDIETRVHVGDELVWESTAATFHRMANERKGAEDEELELPRTKPFIVPADAGRRYAAVSGDYNPVHLHPLTSRAFGFKKPIAHGWWLTARCLAELGVDDPQVPTTYQLEFRRPVALGDTYQLQIGPEGKRFAVADGRGKRRLVGRVQTG